MITGYLLLDREYDPEKIVRFWKIIGCACWFVPRYGLRDIIYS